MAMNQHTLIKNLTFFREKYPYIYNCIREKEPDRDRYQVKHARKSELYTVEVAIESRWQAIHSLYDPYQEAVRLAKSSIKSDTTTVILFGLGLGYAVEAMLELNPTLKFYIVEPDFDLFLYALEVRDWTVFPWSAVEQIAIGEHPDVISTFCHSFLSRIGDGWKTVDWPAHRRIYSQQYDMFVDNLRQVRQQYMSSLYATYRFQNNWAENSLENFSDVMSTPSIYDYREYFEGRRVILVASGPSLVNLIPLIKQVQDEKRAFIIAAGTGIKALLNQGVKPDAMISYDPHENNYKALQPVFSEGVPLIFGSTIHHRIVDEYEGPLAHFITSQDQLTPYLNPKLNCSEIILDSPTVTLIAIQLLTKMKCSAIYLAGQDLCFVKGEFYASGVSDSGNQAEDTQDYPMIENNQGEMVRTTRSFLLMKKNIESYIKKYSLTNIFNLSEVSAKIEGVSYISPENLSQLLKEEKLPQFNFSFPRIANKSKDKYQQRLVDSIKSLRSSFKKLQKLKEDIEQDNGLSLSAKKRFVLQYNKDGVEFVQHPAFLPLLEPWMRTTLLNMERKAHALKNVSVEMQLPEVKKLLSLLIREAEEALGYYEERLGRKSVNENRDMESKRSKVLSGETIIHPNLSLNSKGESIYEKASFRNIGKL
jgi:hypothetical protein